MAGASNIQVFTGPDIDRKIEKTVVGALKYELEQHKDELDELRQQLNILKPVLTHEEAARYASVSRERILQKCRSGELPSNKDGRIYYIKRADLERHLTGQD